MSGRLNVPPVVPPTKLFLGGIMDKQSWFKEKFERALTRANRVDVFTIFEKIDAEREKQLEELGITVKKETDRFYIEDWNPISHED